MPLPAPVGNQVRLTVGSEEMTVLLSGRRRRPDGYALLGLTKIGQRLSGQLAEHLPPKGRRLIESTIGESDWYLDDRIGDNPFFPLMGQLLLDPRTHAIINEIVIGYFVVPQLRAKFTPDVYPPVLYGSVSLYFGKSDEPLNPHPFPINKVELAE